MMVGLRMWGGWPSLGGTRERSRCSLPSTECPTRPGPPESRVGPASAVDLVGGAPEIAPPAAPLSPRPCTLGSTLSDGSLEGCPGCPPHSRSTPGRRRRAHSLRARARRWPGLLGLHGRGGTHSCGRWGGAVVAALVAGSAVGLATAVRPAAAVPEGPPSRGRALGGAVGAGGCWQPIEAAGVARAAAVAVWWWGLEWLRGLWLPLLVPGHLPPHRRPCGPRAARYWCPSVGAAHHSCASLLGAPGWPHPLLLGSPLVCTLGRLPSFCPPSGSTRGKGTRGRGCRRGAERQWVWHRMQRTCLRGRVAAGALVRALVGLGGLRG